MITGFAKKIKLVCAYHEENVEMYVKQTANDAFFACPKYYPTNRESWETPCMNRISIREYEKMIETITEYIQDEEEENGIAYLKNYKFETNIAKYKVLEDSKGKLVISVALKRMITY